MAKKTRTNSKKNSDKHIAKIAKRVLYKNSETKLKMNHINEISFLTTAFGSFYDPMLITPGSANNQRIGNNITLSGFQFKGVMTSQNTTSVQYLRMALFYAKDRSNITTSSEIFINSAGNTVTGSTIGGLDKMYHPFNKSLVSVLHDKVYKLAPATNEKDKSTRFFNMFVKLHNRKVEYENGSVGGAENVSPRLHLAVWTADANDDGTTTGLELSGMERLWYKDI